jgi:hypothetical protein
MKSRRLFAPRLAYSLCGLGGFLCFAANAQSPATAPAPAPAYQDKYIGGGSLSPDISMGDNSTSDTDGLARSVQIDAVASVLTSHDAGSAHNVTEDGLIAKTQWETAAYGAWSLDAALRTGASNSDPAEQGQGGVITLRQRGMPFDGDWRADNALGDINSPDISMARFQPRFYLPTAPLQGLTTEWHGPSGLQIVAGGGVPGVYEGIVVPNFKTLDGSTATAGAQWSPTSNWTVGGQLIEARDVNLAIGPVIDATTRMSSTTGLLSAGWENGGEHIQANFLDGNVNGQGNSFGTWIDASFSQGRIVQNAGVFRIDPDLTWGNQLITNDAQGGYYRLSYQNRQWLADVGVDEVRSVSGLGSNTTFLTGDTRYQLSRDWGVGGVANVSRTDGGSSWSLEGFIDHSNGGGIGRVQADYTQTPVGQDSSFTLNQAWSTPAGMRLSTSASLERISGAVANGLAQDSTVLRLGAFGGGQFSNGLGIDGNVLWARAVQGRAAPGVSANVSLIWQLAHDWQILATYYDSRVGSWESLAVISPLTPPVATPVAALQERGVFLTLRYRRASGSHFAPLGGAPGAGSGEIAGVIYLDANNNGQPDAGEAGAPNITVVLDGRFSVQTDAAGRFSFPVVATGHHVITVVADNLPLPWVLIGDGRKETDVTTRDRTNISIGAQRPR